MKPQRSKRSCSSWYNRGPCLGTRAFHPQAKQRNTPENGDHDCFLSERQCLGRSFWIHIRKHKNCISVTQFQDLSSRDRLLRPRRSPVPVVRRALARASGRSLLVRAPSGVCPLGLLVCLFVCVASVCVFVCLFVCLFVWPLSEC